MNIKRESAIIRQMLYLLATIRNGKITRTAEENGIKTSNLSSLLKDLEKAAGVPLLNRKSDGVEPTTAGRELYKLAREFEETLQKFRNMQSRIKHNEEVYLYLPPNEEVALDAYEDKEYITVVDSFHESDVAILNDAAPVDEAESETTRVIVQNNVLLTNLWIVCRKKQDEKAVRLYRFLVDSIM